MHDHRDDDIDWDRLDRFIRGVGSPDERAASAAWVNADPQLREIAAAMRTVGRARNGTPLRPNAHRALLNVQQQLGIHRPPARVSRPVIQAKRRQFFSVERVAMAVGVVGLIALTIRIVDHRNDAAQIVAGPPPREFATEPGRRASIELADGSRVVLSAGSRLTVPGDLGAAQSHRREVMLAGEAYFSVRHDSTRPFVVRTPYGTAEDLGTEFVVNTYPETHGMCLAVRQGRVEVRQGDSVAILERGDVARVLSNGRFSVERGRDVTGFFGAASGALILRDTRLRDAAPMLERWFGIQIHVADQRLLSRKITGTFHEEAAVSAIGVIALALESSTNWNGNEVTFTPRIGRAEP